MMKEILVHDDRNINFGISLADGAGATISSPWDFPPKVLEISAKGSSDFLQVPWERQKRVQVRM